MQPFHELVSRIRYHPDEDIAAYVVGYEDRLEGGIVELPLALFVDGEVPEHRVRYVRRGAVVVWQRPERAPG